MIVEIDTVYGDRIRILKVISFRQGEDGSAVVLARPYKGVTEETEFQKGTIKEVREIK